MGYKEDKVAFVSHATGGPVTRINLVCATALTTYILWTVVQRRTLSKLPSTSLKTPILEFLILVLPLLLALTLFSARPLLLNAILLLATAFWHVQPTPLGSPPLSPKLEKSRRHSRMPSQIDSKPFSRPFVTSYRAIMMVMTVLCILAVDFPVFPREFAKAETWGTSLMDLGVGSFVFSLGLVSALPLLRSYSSPSSAHTRCSYFSSVFRSIRKCLPLVVLGMVRVVMVKGVDYPEHVTEYGVHWNFFFTLALLPVFGTALEGLAEKVDMHVVGLAVGVVHQLAVSWPPLQHWALEAPRTTLISQNKEGIVSFPGYLSIYLLGLATGLYTLPPSPTFFSLHARSPPPHSTATEKREWERKREKSRSISKPGKLAEWIGSAAANLPYVLWTVAFNTSFIFAYLMIHLVVASSSSSSSSPAVASNLASQSPAIFHAINQNGLVVFLVANLLTGLINVLLPTMYMRDSLAVLVLVGYAAMVAGVAWALRGRRVKV
ncbi:phosphatidylinositol glycan, class W [Rhodotorula toruloides]|uniref:GPI-anchored wall transfer protein n=1 Tax=Rhodotorula toruloides TaxID=5286 RepID=A0A511KGK1_RHOTO|nr:phosphatidylinositol glycan, class W [Rhodotorula toruloides]